MEPPPLPSGPPSLRIVGAETGAKPHQGVLVQGEQRYDLLVWSPEVWSRLPEACRPGDARLMSGGAWYTLRPRPAELPAADAPAPPLGILRT